MLDDGEILFWMSISGITVHKQSAAIKYAGDVRSVWEKLGADDKLNEIFGKKYEILLRYHSEQYVSDCLERLGKMNIKVMTIYNPLYGTMLRQKEVVAPYVFYYKGNAKLFSTDCIGVVGTRGCSSYGKRMTEKIAGEIASGGFTVVSGLANGIDSFAHKAALDACGKTIAVLGSGLNEVSPQSNMSLLERIIDKGGAVMSEYLPNVVATPYTFPERNRLISGLSKGVCVVEAGTKSGALITARYALEQNRDVFAVPGNVESIRSEGTNNLLYEGALIARNGNDILSHYGKEINGINQKKIIDELDNDSKKIYDLIKTEDSVPFDNIVDKLNMNPSQVSVIITSLEMDGLIKKVSSNEFADNGD